MGCSFYTIFSRFAGQGGGGQYIVLCYLGWGSGQVASGPDKGPWWLECWVGTDQYFFERVGP